jgi:hypothetical protein
VQSTIAAVAGVRTTTDATITDSNGKTHDVTVESRDPVATGRLIDQIHQNAAQQASAYFLDQTVEPGASVQGWIAFHTNTKRISTATFQMTIGPTTFQFPFVIDAKTHAAR